MWIGRSHWFNLVLIRQTSVLEGKWLSAERVNRFSSKNENEWEAIVGNAPN